MASTKKEPKENSRHIELTDKQVNEMEVTAHAFALAGSGLLERPDYVRSAQHPLRSRATAYRAITYAIRSNFGMALELKLKILHAKSNDNKSPTGHELSYIFEKLPEPIQEELEKVYRERPSLSIIAYKVGSKNKKPSKPKTPLPSNFHEFLIFLDKSITMYDSRYFFEKYNQYQWWFDIDPQIFFHIINRMTEYSNSLKTS